jgi:hypothetical protein
MSRMPPAGHLVRAGVARADRLRRSRETARRLWRAAPIAAAICVAVAAGGRWAGWPVFVPLGAVALAGAVLAGYVFSTRRDHAVSDLAAAEIDAHAGLGGELRSAHWFSEREGQNPWIDLHLGRAAERVQGIDWTQLYPAVRASRAKIASAIMAAGALALAVSVPGGIGIQARAHTPATAATARTQRPSSVTALPPDLQRELEELLKLADSGGTASGGKALTASELRDLLARIDKLKGLQQALKDGKLDPNTPGGKPGEVPDDLKALTERLKRASEMGSLSPELKDALSDAAEKLADASNTQSTTPKDPQEAMAAADAQKGAAAQSKTAGSKEENSIQAVKDASAGGGAGVVMMSSQDASSGKDPGLGLGGGSAQDRGRGHMADLGAALRKETIEATTDNPGENIETQMRRNTERGDATVAYTKVAPRAFERGRSSAPPAVPEGRRAAVHSYFIRKQ